MLSKSVFRLSFAQGPHCSVPRSNGRSGEIVALGVSLNGDDTPSLPGPQHTGSFDSHSAGSSAMKSGPGSGPRLPLAPQALLCGS